MRGKKTVKLVIQKQDMDTTSVLFPGCSEKHLFRDVVTLYLGQWEGEKMLPAPVHCSFSFSASLPSLPGTASPGQDADVATACLLFPPYCPGTEGCPSSWGWAVCCRGLLVTCSEGSTNPPRAHGMAGCPCLCLPRDRGHVLALFLGEPHPAVCSAFPKGRIQERKRGEGWDGGYDGRKQATWAFGGKFHSKLATSHYWISHTLLHKSNLTICLRQR